MLNHGLDKASVTSVLQEVCQASDLEGLAILDLSSLQSEYVISYSVGAGGPNTIAIGHRLLAANPGGAAHMIALDRRPIIVCPWLSRPARPGGLVLWRSPTARRWTEADHGLVAALAVLVRASIEVSSGQIAIDRVTGLPNRRWFINETSRHIDRLDKDRQVGNLVLVAIDDLSQLTATLGPGTGDTVLLRVASHLSSMIRPGDILARVAIDEFAIWQTGMDHLTAAERADALCSAHLFDDLQSSRKVTFSIGIASRPPDGAEDVRTLLRRALMVAREVRRGGVGGWRVSLPPARRDPRAAPGHE